jgi:hypothetical protein
MPDVKDIPIRRLGSFQHSDQLMAEHIFFDHDKHGYAQVALQFVAGAEIPPIDLHFDVWRFLVIGKQEEQSVSLYIFLFDGSELPKDIFRLLKNKIFFDFVEKIEIEVKRKAAQIIEEVSGGAAFKT